MTKFGITTLVFIWFAFFCLLMTCTVLADDNKKPVKVQAPVDKVSPNPSYNPDPLPPITVTTPSIDEPPISPKFFLLLRFWTNQQNGKPAWSYSPEFTNTLEEALARLNSGRGFNGLESVEVVGLWDLNNCKVNIDFKESDKVIPVRVEEQKYKVRTWYVKSGK